MRSRPIALALCLVIPVADCVVIAYLESVRHIGGLVLWGLGSQAILQAVPAALFRPSRWPYLARFLVMAVASTLICTFVSTLGW